MGALVAILFFQPVDLIKQIDRLAASEPAPYGIDTRIRTAEVLTTRYPRIARQELRDAEAELPGVLDADYGNILRVQIVGHLAPLDFAEAERVAKTIGPERKNDRLAQAYDQLCDKAGTRNRVELMIRALDAGAFRLNTVTKDVAPDEAQRLFGAFVTAFPGDAADPADIDYLLDRTAQFIRVDRQLALAAIQKAVSAAREQPEERRGALRMRAADLLRELGGEVPEDLRELLAEPGAKPPKEKPAAKPDDARDFSKMPYAEALEQALKIEDPTDRAGQLIELSRREDLTPKQQGRVALDALSAANQMSLSEERLWAFSMLSRDFAKRSDLANAALAAQMLSETYGKVCGCGGPLCEVNGNRFECVTLVNDYAEYLSELNFTQESLGLNNISLEARLLVVKLYNALNAKGATTESPVPKTGR